MLAHVGNRGEHRVQRSPEMRGHGFFEVGDAHVIDGANRDHAGVVDEHVQPSVTVDDLRDHAPGVFFAGDVGDDDRGVDVVRQEISFGSE